MRRTYSKELKAQVIHERLHLNMKPRELALKYNIPAAMVTQWVWQLKNPKHYVNFVIPTSKRIKHRVSDEEVKSIYNSVRLIGYKNYKQISYLLNIPYSTVYYYLNRNDRIIKQRETDKRRRFEKLKNQEKYNKYRKNLYNELREKGQL